MNRRRTEIDSAERASYPKVSQQIVPCSVLSRPAHSASDAPSSQVPIQRVTKYPLLLSRLRNVTPASHESSAPLAEAQERIELHLEHMNAVSVTRAPSERSVSLVLDRARFVS